MANTKYKLSDASRMLKSLESGNNTGYRKDANLDGKLDRSDVETMMKIAAGWDTDAAMNPYSGKEVKPAQYDDKKAYLLGKTVNRQPFSFSGGGELYDAYAKQYRREGELAAKDTLSKLSGRTGGVPSSYAATAVAAGQNQYAAKLADKIPEIYDAELNKYYRDAELDRADLSTLLGVKAQELSEAGTKAGYGDYSWLEALGIDTTKLKEEDLRKYADWRYQYGDYSGLDGLGVDTTNLKKDDAKADADWRYQYGDYSGLNGLGVDTSNIVRDDKLEYALQLWEIGDPSGIIALGIDPTRVLKAWEDADEATRLSNEIAQAQLYNLQKENSGGSGYTEAEENSIATRLGMGANYWTPDVKKYVYENYNMSPAELYWQMNQYDVNGLPTGLTLYDVVRQSLDDKGITNVRLLSEETWKRKYGSGGNYTEYLRGIINQYL